jgi:hypothetical protein
MLSVFAPTALFAHHSAAMYDDHKKVTVQGTVTKFEWSNPHVYVYLEQTTDSGQRVTWEVECSPPSILRRLGWTQDTLHSGDVITISGKPARDGARKSLLPVSIARGDTVLFDRKGELAQLTSAGEAPAAASAAGVHESLEGIWLTLFVPQIEEAMDPDKLKLTPKGKKAAKAFNEKKMHPGAQCIPYPAPVFMVTPDLKRITRAGDTLLIDGEFDGAQRVVHLNLDSHNGAPDSVQGHSIGQWDGKELKIDTDHFAAHALGNAYGLPSGASKHLTERLTLGADGKSLAYHFELSDPEYMAQTLSGDVQWVFRPDLKYAPPPCDADNARRFTHN